MTTNCIVILCFNILLGLKNFSFGEEESKIVGGFEADKSEYPYAVSLRTTTDHHICGGVLIDNQHVVTAAHCLDEVGHFSLLDALSQPAYVVVGSSTLSHFSGVHYRVTSQIPHPDYNGTSITNDIGIITVDRHVTYSQNFPERMTAPISTLEAKNTSCTAMGWGLTKAHGELSHTFKAVNVQVVPQADCKKEWEEHYNPCLICTDSKDHGVCQGDSGGPLICNNQFAGVVSFGKPCATGTPDMFTSVSCYNDWIDSVIKKR